MGYRWTKVGDVTATKMRGIAENSDFFSQQSFDIVNKQIRFYYVTAFSRSLVPHIPAVEVNHSALPIPIYKYVQQESGYRSCAIRIRMKKRNKV